MKRLIVFAPNVGVGGGAVLLSAILANLGRTRDLLLYLDERGAHQFEVPDNAALFWCRPAFRSRLAAERHLSAAATADDIIFCFHNLPPIFPVACKVICYVHNSNLVGLIPSSHLAGWVRLRIAIERVIARGFRHRVDRYLVQTPTMARALARWYGCAAPGKVVPSIDILPFVDPQAMPAPPTSIQGLIRWDFLYVSDGAINKNHARLFEAWTLLAKEGLFPSLAVTLHPERDLALRDKLASLKDEFGLAIVDLGQMAHAEVLKQYRAARALFFASYAESFGIPLLEAQAAGLPIIAAELDFVRDMCTPIESFDPYSPISMARAVKRFMKLGSDAITPLTPEQFVQKLIAIEASHTEISTGK